jgi:hypothetical protein
MRYLPLGNLDHRIRPLALTSRTRRRGWAGTGSQHVGRERPRQGKERVGGAERLVSRRVISHIRNTALNHRNVRSLICQLLEWEKVLRQQDGRLGGKEERAMNGVERPGPDASFAKREAQDLDERMKARSSKRRKSEPDCGAVEA